MLAVQRDVGERIGTAIATLHPGADQAPPVGDAGLQLAASDQNLGVGALQRIDHGEIAPDVDGGVGEADRE